MQSIRSLSRKFFQCKSNASLKSGIRHKQCSQNEIQRLLEKSRLSFTIWNMQWLEGQGSVCFCRIAFSMNQKIVPAQIKNAENKFRFLRIALLESRINRRAWIEFDSLKSLFALNAKTLKRLFLGYAILIRFRRLDYLAFAMYLFANLKRTKRDRLRYGTAWQ